MKLFKLSALVCLFFFMIACEDGSQRFIPIDETDDGSSEITDDSDSTEPTNPTDDPTGPTDPTEPTEPTDPTDEPTNPTDEPTEPTNPTDDPTDPTDEPTNPTEPTDEPTEPTDEPTNPTDEPTNPTDEPTNPTDEPTNPTDEPTNPTDEPTNPTEPTEPTIPEGACSAVFDGTTSVIEVASNAALNLNFESKTWTIEAWIKQADADLTSDNVPIVRKGTGSTPVYLLTGYKKQSWGGNYSFYSLMGYVKFSYPASTGIPYVAEGSGELTPTGNNVNYSAEWSHVAMVQNAVTSGTNQWNQTTTYKLLLFLNGKQIASEEYKSSSNSSGIGGGNNNSTSVVPTIETNEEALVIGANLNAGLFFKGLIDSIKISNTAKYTAAFTPAALSVDDTTMAFWDFNGNTTESKNGIESTATGITYSTDCK